MVERTRSMTHFLPRQVIELDYSSGIRNSSSGRIIFASDLSAALKREANRTRIKRERDLERKKIPDGNYEDANP